MWVWLKAFFFQEFLSPFSHELSIFGVFHVHFHIQASKKTLHVLPAQSMVEFFTEGPGPGAYNVKSTFGAPWRMDVRRNQGPAESLWARGVGHGKMVSVFVSTYILWRLVVNVSTGMQPEVGTDFFRQDIKGIKTRFWYRSEHQFTSGKGMFIQNMVPSVLNGFDPSSIWGCLKT